MNLAPGIHRDLGLTDEEYKDITGRLDREPTFTELAMFSVMWSEHCSYKSSKVHLQKLPSTGAHVLVGPGEGAGVIEVAPGVAVAWKMESHNHPSFVEPFSGAATGVGGIVRDVLSMGARPIALMDPLRFGPLEDARTRYVVDGVVHGISAYGNSIGVPTVGGEAVFEDCYAENPLINVACLGIVESKLMRGRADGVGNQAILIGSSTGRDGIGGASVLASAEFDEESLEKRPSVQIGDPFTEKLLIEACLELIQRGLLVGLQDLGAGGISCPTSEMVAKSKTGMRVHLDAVHLREPEMKPFEIMISESQERMLAVVTPSDVDETLVVCRRWGLTASVIGEVTDSGRVEVVSAGEIVADSPAEALAEEAPTYERPLRRPDWIDQVAAADPGDEAPDDVAGALLRVLSSPSNASKRWIFEQYDHMLFLGTVRGPGADAAVVRLPDRQIAVALATDGPGRYCYLDPYEGARLAVAEAARNVATVGARPLAITNCLNFGNPEKPEVMWQFAEVVRGMADACASLGTPVTGGNVSFYNETKGRPIYPTPVIGMLGVLSNADLAVGAALANGAELVLLGTSDHRDFGGSEYAKVCNGVVAGRPPRLDLGVERALHGLLQHAATERLVLAAHDLSKGGLGVALVESAIAGDVGFSVDLPEGEPHRVLFSESPSRAVVACADSSLEGLLQAAESFGVETTVMGRVGGSKLDFGSFAIPLADARVAYEDALPRALSTSMEEHGR
jgi:phosphoribosylformylglycinamidine synthase II